MSSSGLSGGSRWREDGKVSSLDYPIKSGNDGLFTMSSRGVTGEPGGRKDGKVSSLDYPIESGNDKIEGHHPA